VSWLSVSFEVADSDVEAVTDALLAAGALAVDVADADAGSPAERAVFDEPGTAPPRAWRRNLLSALVNEHSDPAMLLAAACARAGVALPPHRVRRIADEDAPFGGSWTIELEEVRGGCRITVTENGEIYNPIFRLIARLMLHPTDTIDQYLTMLAKQLGEELKIEG